MPQLMLVNPRKRRPARRRPAAKRRRTVAVRRASPVRHRRRNPIAGPVRRRRRNPSTRVSTRGIINQQLTPALIAGSGALALDMLWGFMPIPEGVKVGPLRYLAKGAGAVLLGMVAGNVVNRSTAQQMSIGALTVIMHDAMREVTQNVMPNVPLGYYNAGMPVGEYVNNGMSGLGAYVTDSNYNPYLAANGLSSPFYGPSGAQEAEAHATMECEGYAG